MNTGIQTADSELIPPLHDVMFSTIFRDMGSAKAAQSLINAVLTDAGREPVSEILDLRSQEVFLPSDVRGRNCRLDVSAKADGHEIDIEVQLRRLPEMIDRSLYYSGHIINRAVAPGGDYRGMPRVSMINLLDFVLRADHPDFHQPVALTYVKGNQRATDLLYVHNIELPKFRRERMDMQNPLHRWLFFLDKGYKMPEDSIVKEALQMDEGLQQFAEKYKLSLDDPRTRHTYINFQMGEMDQRSWLAQSKAEGRTEGIAEGIAEGEARGMEKFVRAMFLQGTPTPQIKSLARKANFPMETVDRIGEEIRGSVAKRESRTREQ